MPLEKLQKQIVEDAKSKAGQIEKDAKEEAEAINKETKERAKQMEDEASEEIEQELKRMEEEYKANSEMQERGAVLNARERAVESFIPKIRSLVMKKALGKVYEKLIERAIKEASNAYPQQDLTLVISKKDAKLVHKFKGKIEYGDVGSGVEIYAENGKVKISATLEGFFEQNLQEIQTLLTNEAFSKFETHEETKKEKQVPKKKMKTKQAGKKKKNKKR